jgi:hypothetical protein
VADALGGMVPFGGGQQRALKVVQDITKSISGGMGGAYDRLLMKAKAYTAELEKQAKLTKAISGGGGGSGLMAGSLGSFSGPIQAPKLGGGGGGPIQPPTLGGMGGGFAATAGRVALGLGAFTFAGLPNTQDAVSQRIAAQSVASFSGMSANQLVSQVNQIGLASGGITSSSGMTMAAANLYYGGGMLAGSRSFNNFMGQVGGVSAMSGLSNERAAAAYAGINGMRSLQLGVNVRGPRGELLAPNQIASNLYNRMYGAYGTSRVTNEQAALVWNPNSRAHQAVMAMAGGNQDLFQALATNIQLQAANGGKMVDLSNASSVMDKLGFAKDDPRRAIFNKNASDTKLLQNSSNGLIGGYDAAAKAAGAAADALSRLPQPVLDSIAAIKGFSESLGGMNNAGSALTGLLGSLAKGIGDVLGAMMLMRGGGLGGLLGKGGGGAIGGGLKSMFSGLTGRLGATRLGGLLTSTLGRQLGGKTLLGAIGGISLGRGLLGAGVYYGMDKAEEWLNTNLGADKDSGMFRKGAATISRILFDAGKGGAAGAATAGPWGGVIGSVAGLGQGIWNAASGQGWDYGTKGSIGPQGMGAGPTDIATGSRVNSAVAWAGAAAAGSARWFHLCDKYVANAYGLSHSGYESAKKHWAAIPSKYKHPGDRNPPAGALVFWSCGVYGHAALSLGGGKISSTHRNQGTPMTMTLAEAIKDMNGYYGWAEPYFGGQVVAPTGSPAAKAAAQRTAESSYMSGGDAGSMAPGGSGISVDSSGIHSSGVGATAAALLALGGSGAGAVGATLSGKSLRLGSGGGSTPGGSNITTTGNIPTGAITGGATKEAFARAILSGLHAPINDVTMYALTQWMNHEDGRGGKGSAIWANNPLNTTQSWAGAWSRNSVGVKGYQDYNSGLAATLKTLNLSYYSKVRSAFLQGNSVSNIIHAIDASPWGTHNFGDLYKKGVKNQYDVGTERVQYDQVARVHKDEMIIPAKAAEMIRNGKSGASNQVTINVNVKSASEAEAVKFARKVKAILEQDDMISAVGRF